MKLPKLPQLLSRKIYKTGQTRGADDDVIYQNRVGRNSTVLIPYAHWTVPFEYPPGEDAFENGFIVLISPDDYFDVEDIDLLLESKGLKLGENCLVFYQTRAQWNDNNPDKLNWIPAENRTAPLGGQYVARIAATTALEGGERIVKGFSTTAGKGAGIRVFEYASSDTNEKCRYQLEALFWLCVDSMEVVTEAEMSRSNAEERKSEILRVCEEMGLLDYDKLVAERCLNRLHRTVCPLCLEELSAMGFFNKVLQAAGREVHDLTVTEINLFHIDELRVGTFNHRPYNLGWGHHHCNVVTKDAGVEDTLKWMEIILERNREGGLLS